MPCPDDLKAPRVQPDGSELFYPDELALEETMKPRPGDRLLTDLIDALRRSDPTWRQSVARADAYKRSQDDYYRRRAERLTGRPAPSVRLGDIMECLCGARIRRTAEGLKYDYASGKPHICGRSQTVGAAAPPRSVAEDRRTQPKQLPAPKTESQPRDGLKESLGGFR